MPTKRLTMRKIREILRLRYDCKLTFDKIATSCGIGRTTVSDYLKRFEASPLRWPLFCSASRHRCRESRCRHPISLPFQFRTDYFARVTET